MSTLIRFLRPPEHGQIRHVPFRVGVDLIARGEAEDARNLSSTVDVQPVPVIAKAPVVAAKPAAPRRSNAKRTTKRKRK